MPALYRIPLALPSLLLVCVVVGCDSEPPAPKVSREAPAPSNVYAEALREAKAAKDSAERRNVEQQRIDNLLGRAGAQPAIR